MCKKYFYRRLGTAVRISRSTVSEVVDANCQMTDCPISSLLVKCSSGISGRMECLEAAVSIWQDRVMQLLQNVLLFAVQS